MWINGVLLGFAVVILLIILHLRIKRVHLQKKCARLCKEIENLEEESRRLDKEKECIILETAQEQRETYNRIHKPGYRKYSQ